MPKAKLALVDTLTATPAPRIQAQRNRLNIGCGRSPSPVEEGWINCDLHPGPGVDYVFDACGRWPFEDESMASVESYHTLEHLPDPMAFFREAWRVLIPNGSIKLRVPHAYHNSAWWDLTHLRPWLQESFAILQPGFTHFTRNFQHEHLGFAFWVDNAVMVFEAQFARLWRWRMLRPFCRWAGKHLNNVYRDVIVEAFKTTEDDPLSVAYGGTRNPAIVYCSWGVYGHEYRGEAQPKNSIEILIFTGNER